MRPGGSGDEDPNRPPERSRVFDPPQGSLGERRRVDLPTSGEAGEVQGTTDGRGSGENVPSTPYTDRAGEYREEALRSLDSLSVPSSMRSLVRDYFTQIQP